MKLGVDTYQDFVCW